MTERQSKKRSRDDNHLAKSMVDQATFESGLQQMGVAGCLPSALHPSRTRPRQMFFRVLLLLLFRGATIGAWNDFNDRWRPSSSSGCAVGLPLGHLTTRLVPKVLPTPFWQVAEAAKWKLVTKTLPTGALSGRRPTSKKDHNLNPCDTSRMYFG
jgi:hypothetical protein